MLQSYLEKQSADEGLMEHAMASLDITRPVDLEFVIPDIVVSILDKNNRTRKHDTGVRLGLANKNHSLCIEQYPEIDCDGAHIGFRMRTDEVKLLNSRSAGCGKDWIINLSILQSIQSQLILPELENDLQENHSTTISCWCSVEKDEKWEPESQIDITIKDASRYTAHIQSIVDAIREGSVTASSLPELTDDSNNGLDRASSITKRFGVSFSEMELAYLEKRNTRAVQEGVLHETISVKQPDQVWFDYRTYSPPANILSHYTGARGNAAARARGGNRASRGSRGSRGRGFQSGQRGGARTTNIRRDVYNSNVHRPPIALADPERAARVDEQLRMNSVALQWWNTRNLATAEPSISQASNSCTSQKKELRRGGAVFCDTMTAGPDYYLG